MRIGIPRESRAGETLVAATAKTASQLKDLGYDVVIEKGAGAKADQPDSAFEAAGIEIGTKAKVWASDAPYTLEADPAKVYSAYVLDGALTLNGEPAKQFDFVLLTEQSGIEMHATTGAKVFLIASPANPGYRTYSQLRRGGA